MVGAGRTFALVFIVAAAAAAHPLSAQVGRGGGGLGIYGFGPRLGENIQFALENQAQLGLSAEQVASLRELQAGIQQEVEPIEAEIDDLRLGIISGAVDRVDGIVALRELFAEFNAAAAPYRAGVASVLTVDQHRALQGMMWSTGAGLGAGWGRGAGVGPGVALGALPGPGLGLGARRFAGPGWGAGARPMAGRGMGPGWGRGRGAGLGLARRWR